MITENKIKQYIEDQILYDKALLIDDSWGIGKSTLVKNLLSGEIKEFTINGKKSYLIINANEISEKTSLRKLLLSESKKINTNKFIDDADTVSNIANFILQKKKTIKSILEKTAVMFDGFIENKTGVESVISNSLDILGIEGESILRSMNYDDYILVIDEVDRMSNPENLKNIYSKIIELQENTKIKIIVIMNSLRVNESYHDDWKDKIYSVSIKIAQTMYFDSIKPKIWNEVENKIKEITPNYRNIRILKQYLSLECYMDNIINKHLKNVAINEYQKEHIDSKKKKLITDFYSYYNKKDYEKYKLKNDNKHHNNLEIEDIENIVNMETDFLDKRLKEILNKYNNEYAQFKDSIDFFFKNFIHKNQNIKKNKKKDAFNFVKNELINKNLNIINLIPFEINELDKETSIIYYLKYLKNDFKISTEQENELINIIHIKLNNIKESLKNLSENEKLNELNKQRIMYSYIAKEIIFSSTTKQKILKSIKKNIKKIYKDIINNYHDNISSELKHFHYKYNSNIIDDIYKSLNDQDVLLIKLRDFKNYSQDCYKQKISLYNSNLKKGKITKDELVKV